MAKTKDAARITALSEELLRALESQRQQGGGAYPPTLQRLAEVCEGSPPMDQVLQAAGKKPFSERAVAFEKEKNKPRPESYVYFKGDKSAEERLKERALGELAERMVAVLESQRRLGADSYPLSLRRLAELCDLKASDTRVPGAIGHDSLARRVVVSKKKGKKADLDAQVFLRDDLATILPALILSALRQSRTGLCRAFTAKDLAKATPALKDDVTKALGKERIEDLSLPPDVAWVPGPKGEPILFLTDDLRPAGRRSAPAASRPGEPIASPTVASNGPSSPRRRDFAEAFRQAFEGIDRRNGATNFVKLSELRRALPEFSREEFDAGLRQLRLEGQFSLDSHEGLHGTLTPEDREAGVREVGSLLIYASRR